MYPESSSMAIIINIKKMRGANPIIPPTPPIIPFTINDFTKPSGKIVLKISVNQEKTEFRIIVGISLP